MGSDARPAPVRQGGRACGFWWVRRCSGPLMSFTCLPAQPLALGWGHTLEGGAAQLSIPLRTVLSLGEYAPASRGQPGFQWAWGRHKGTVEVPLQVIRLLPLIWPHDPCFHHFRAVLHPCAQLAPSFSLTGQGLAHSLLLCSGSMGKLLRPLCPWDGCCWTQRHGECCESGRGAGRVLGCRCKGPGQECAHLAL